MLKRFLHSPVAFVSVAWAILLPLGIVITIEVAISLQSTFSKAAIAAIMIVGVFLTGGALGLPLSYSLARVYPKMNLSKGAIICDTYLPPL